MKHDNRLASANNLGNNSMYIPHHGSLCRIVEENDFEPSHVLSIYVEDFGSENSHNSHELVFNRHDYEFASWVFAILDSESTSVVDKDTIQEFVYRRCPVFWRRDEDLMRLGLNYNKKQCKNNQSKQGSTRLTFNEIWASVVACSKSSHKKKNARNAHCLGLEGWMVFFRFIALAQYLEAKRRFSARHLQQTMRHRNSPRGSEMVVVDVPPAEPPVPLTPWQLAMYEQNNKTALPAPELDLDHSLLAAHDCNVNYFDGKQFPNGHVKIALFGSSSSSLNKVSSKDLEFAVTYCQRSRDDSSEVDEVVVRRSMLDMKWFNETISSHRVLGGTLCGRILPPFPGSSSITNKALSSHFHDDSSSSILPSTNSLKKTTGSAINVAAAGVGRIRDVAKSFMGGYLSSSSTPSVKTEEIPVALIPPSTIAPSHKSSISLSHKQKTSRKKALSLALPENYYNPNSPSGKARQLERYLNYLLEHPALSTSFPLNTILKASQSGIEAAKQCLEECSRVSKEIKDRTPQLVDGKVGIPFWPQGTPNSTTFAWVRTAAQAAVALKVHGMLETSGLPSASARLQHASLPSFGHISSRGSSGWEDFEIEAGARMPVASATVDSKNACNNFEEGVVIDDGFDLLPLPVPAPERRILSAGSITQTNYSSSERQREERFHYGTPAVQGRYTLDDDDDIGSAFLGDISVDENIDKLREVIGSVDNTLSRCLASAGGIGKAHRELQNLHLSIVGGLDSWTGMRGKFVSQRSILKGIAGIEQSKTVSEEGDLALIDDLSWQTSLASSAVSAAEDVRAAVRASRTASNARATASSAALSAQQACEKGEFASIDDARAAQTRASIAQSHAIHAAVVEHEAKTVKRRATLALAHDVKTWNIHRKREMLRSCLAYAKSQHEASRRAVDSWSSLSDGFIGSTMAPATVDRRHIVVPPAPRVERRRPHVEPGEATATFFEAFDIVENQPGIIAVEHNVLSSVNTDFFSMQHAKSIQEQDPETFFPFAEAAPIPEGIGEEQCNSQSNSRRSDASTMMQESGNCSVAKVSGESKYLLDISQNDYHAPNTEPECWLDASASHEVVSDQAYMNINTDFYQNTETVCNTDEDVVGDLIDFRRGGLSKHEHTSSSNNDDILSESMQSLVDGLMYWGGGFEAEEEHFALPAGMAATIALEGSGAIGSTSLS